MTQLKNDKEVQTRDLDGGLRFFETIKEAWAYAGADKKVWKVSWTDSDTLERVRFVRTNSGDWVFEPMDDSSWRLKTHGVDEMEKFVYGNAPHWIQKEPSGEG